MTRALLFLLPDAADADTATAWWEYDGDSLLASGTDSAWLPRSADRAREPVRRIGLARPETVRLTRVEPDTLATPQARTAARLRAQGDALGDDAHAAAALDGDIGWVAVTDAAHMTRWLDWAELHDVTLDHIVPLAALMPADGRWHEAQVAGEAVVARDGMAIGADDALRTALVGEEEVVLFGRDALTGRLASAGQSPPVDLRVGAYARRRQWKPDPRRLKEFAIMAGLILVLALAIPLTKAIKWSSEADDLDAQSAAIASSALGRPVTAEEAEGALRGSGGTGGAAQTSQLVASLFAEMQREQLVRANMVAVDPGGRLAARLVAPDVDSINRVLLGLQRRGWQVTANPTPSSDGRSIVDISMGGVS